MPFEFYIDNTDVLVNYGIFITKSKGEQDPLKVKINTAHDWEDEHGTDLDLIDTFYDDRKIQLILAVKATSKISFEDNVHDFLEMLIQPELRLLKFSWLRRAFMVYLESGVSMKRYTHWNDVLMVGQFGINLVCPVPVNRQWINTFTVLQTDVTIDTVDPDEQFTVFWGDGTKTVVTENNGAVSSTYGSAGTYQIIVAGNIQHLNSITVTNASEV